VNNVTLFSINGISQKWLWKAYYEKNFIAESFLSFCGKKRFDALYALINFANHTSSVIQSYFIPFFCRSSSCALNINSAKNANIMFAYIGIIKSLLQILREGGEREREKILKYYLPQFYIILYYIILYYIIIFSIFLYIADIVVIFSMQYISSV